MEELEKFLPSVEEVEAMSVEELKEWARFAKTEIPNRKIQIDPMTHLKKRIIESIESKYRLDISEASKERYVQNAIEECEEKYKLIL